MVAGGTIPWMESVESSLEQRPRSAGAVTEDVQVSRETGCWGKPRE